MNRSFIDIMKIRFDPIGWLQRKIREYELEWTILILICCSFILILTVSYFGWLTNDYFRDVTVEFVGLIFDIIVFGVLIIVINKTLYKKREIKRYKEEIDDFRQWDEKEARFRIAGIIKRLQNLKVYEVDLTQCHLNAIKFNKFKFVNSRFTGTKLEGASLYESTFHSCIFINANLDSASLTSCSFLDSNMIRAHLQDVHAFDVIFKGVNFNYANLKGGRFDEVSFAYADMKMARLQHAAFPEASFQGADLGGAILNYSDFTKVNFDHTKLSGAFMKDADLTKANLKGAILDSVDLTGTKGLTTEQLSQVGSLRNTKLPKEIKDKLRRDYSHLFLDSKVEVGYGDDEQNDEE